MFASELKKIYPSVNATGLASKYFTFRSIEIFAITVRKKKTYPIFISHNLTRKLRSIMLLKLIKNEARIRRYTVLSTLKYLTLL